MYVIYFWDIGAARWILTGNAHPRDNDINVAYGFANAAAAANGFGGLERTRWRYVVVEENTDMRHYPAPLQGNQ